MLHLVIGHVWTSEEVGNYDISPVDGSDDSSEGMRRGTHSSRAA